MMPAMPEAPHTLRVLTAPANFEAWDALLQLLRESFAFMEGRIDPPSSLERMDVEDFKRKATKETLIVALDGTELQGCVFAALREDCVYVGKLAVAASARGQGLARALLAAADELARRHGRPCLELQTRIELTENHRAFAALGFVQVAQTSHPGYDRPTSVTLRRAVQQAVATALP